MPHRNRRSLLGVAIVGVILLGSGSPRVIWLRTGHVLSGDTGTHLGAIVVAIVLVTLALRREWRAWGGRRAMSG